MDTHIGSTSRRTEQIRLPRSLYHKYDAKEKHEEEAAENTAPSRHQCHTVHRHSSGVAGDLHDDQPDRAHWPERRNSATTSTWTTGAASRERHRVEHGSKRCDQDQPG